MEPLSQQVVGSNVSGHFEEREKGITNINNCYLAPFHANLRIAAEVTRRKFSSEKNLAKISQKRLKSADFATMRIYVIVQLAVRIAEWDFGASSVERTPSCSFALSRAARKRAHSTSELNDYTDVQN